MNISKAETGRGTQVRDGDLWDAHPGHKAPVPPHPKDALLG